MKQSVLQLIGLVAILIGTVAFALTSEVRESALKVQEEASQYVGSKNRTAALFFDPKHQVKLGGRVDPYLSELPVADPPPGLTYKKTRVTLQTRAKNVRIHYTLDDSTPDEQSPLYDGGRIDIVGSKILKVRSYQQGRPPSRVKAFSYFRIKDGEPKIGVVSISAPEPDLTYPPNGILINSTKENSQSKILASFEYFGPNGEGSLQRTCQMRVRGGASRMNRKYSFQVNFQGLKRSESEGLPEILQGSPEDVTVLQIRAGGQNASEQLNNLVFDRMCREGGMLMSRSEPVRLYFNGRYHGFYHLRDVIEEGYLERHFPQGEWDVLAADRNAGTHTPPYDGLSSQFEVSGNGLADYRDLLRFVEAADMEDPAVIERVAREVDLEQLVDYWIYNVWAGNMDWPSHNYFIYRNRSATDKRWRWMPWDTDHTFDFPWGHWDRPVLELSTVSAGPGPRRSLNKPLLGYFLIHRLFKNDSFRDRFVSRFYELMDTDLASNRVLEVIHEVYATHPEERMRDRDHWGVHPLNYPTRLEQLIQFTENREAAVREEIHQLFGKGPASQKDGPSTKKEIVTGSKIAPVAEGAQDDIAKKLSEAQPRDQVIVVATGGNMVQRHFPRTIEVLQDGVLILMSGRMSVSRKVDMKGLSNDEIAKAVMETAVENPDLRKGNLLLYRQPIDDNRIFVGGAVASPKFIPVTKGLKLEDAIAAAGERTPKADDQVLIIRSDGQKFSRVYSSAEWNNTHLFSRDRIIVFHQENEG